jgi:hypothetical protein
MIEESPISEIDILADLPTRMCYLGRSISSAQDERKGYRTWFFYRIRERPARAEHSIWDISDQTFRALDALCSYRGLTGSQEFDLAIERFIYWALESLRLGNGLNFRFPDEVFNEVYAFAHDLGRGLMGLLSLTLYYDEHRFKPLLQRFVNKLLEFWFKYDRAFGQIITSDQVFIPIEWDFYEKEVAQPSTSGRSIQSLLRYYKLFLRDHRVLEVAERLAKVNLESSFNSDGTIRHGYSGSHFHSITGLTTALIDLAIIKNDENLLEKARNIFDRGLRPFRTSFGWAKENLSHKEPEGEVCATADLAQAALYLGLAGIYMDIDGYTKYFSEAERIARNHLIATQLLDPLALAGVEGRSKEEIDLIKRSFGSVSGWGLPNQFAARRKEVPDVMLCCSHQAMQALHDLWFYATILNERGLWVNLHFSLETKHAKIESFLPFKGYLRVILKRSVEVFIRKPSFTDFGEVDVKVNGSLKVPNEEKDFLDLGKIEKDSTIEVNFPLKKYTLREDVYGEAYETLWINDTVIDINPRGKDYPIYSNRKVILEKIKNNIINLDAK